MASLAHIDVIDEWVPVGSGQTSLIIQNLGAVGVVFVAWGAAPPPNVLSYGHRLDGGESFTITASMLAPTSNVYVCSTPSGARVSVGKAD